MNQALHITGASVWDGDGTKQRDLYIQNGRIVSEKPTHAVEVDLEGYTIFPGLINAHDHLELNHFPRTKFREVYDNAHQWGEDVNAHLNEEPFKTLRSYPLWDRLFIGGLKNLLCGATTVAHHGPPYKPMYRKDFPVRVLKNYGWAHSLHFNTEEEIIHSYQSTPKDWPWFIHLAEGTDEVAAGEYQRLKKLGCVGENTVIIHGVGMTEEDIADAGRVVRGLVWCPSTNIFLLEQSNNPYYWLTASIPVTMGNDSRLTAAGDCITERTVAIRTQISPDDNDLSKRMLFWHFFGDSAVDRRASAIFGSPKQGNLRIGSYADFFADNTLLGYYARHCFGLVTQDGIPQIGDPELMAKFPHIQTVACTLDGVEKRMNIDLARQVQRCTLKEPGLEMDALPTGKRFIFF